MAISLAHKSITIDVNDRNTPNVVGIVNVNDKATRYLDVTLTASGEKLTFADCTVTATFATDGYLISDSVACTINSAADVITVPLENFKSMSGFLAIEIKIANGETQVLNTPLALKVKVTPSLLDKSMINKDSAGTTAEICREVATARGSSSSLNARLDTVDTNITKKANKSDVDSINSRLQSTETTLKNKANITDMSNGLASKADKVDVTNQLSNLKDDIPQILNSTVKSAGFEVLELEWIEGVIDSATGNVGKSKNNAITDFIPVSSLGNDPIYITPQKGCKVYIYKYDADKNYTGIVVNGATKEVVIIPNSPYYRFMLQKTDGTKFSISVANLCAVSGIKSGALTKELNKLASFTKPSFLLNTKNKIDVEDIFPLIKNYQINGNTGYEFASSKNVMISDFIPIKDSKGNLLVESVEFIFNGKSPSGNAVMFFYDKNKAYLNMQVIADVDSERKTVMLSNYPNANLVRLQYRLDILPSMKIYLNAASGVYEWLKVKRQQIVDDVKIDVGKNYYLIKGEPLELFRHGMIRKKYGNYSKPEGDYLISLNNSPGHTSDYVSKLVFKVPTSVSGNKLGNYEPYTSAPCLRLYDVEMKSLSYQYINIYMSDKTKIANKKRNICFFGDSLTAMGYISKHVKDKLHEYGLTNTKLVGVNTNLDDEENRYTATGGYSWDNYTKDPALLPSNLGKNHLWNPNVNDIDFSYFMGKYGNGETINYVVALIGWNDYDMRNTTWKDYATEGISAIERKARKFIGRLHEQYPNCKVLLVGYHVSTTAERNMHPNLPYEARNKFVWELNDLYKSFEDEFSFVHFIHTASQFDSYNNMRKQNTKPNIYAVNTIEMVTDDVHPAPEGYYQYGDAELRCLMYLMQNEN
nr:MAG TPA: acetylesterase-like prtoein [Caudoviricetes sp.]